MKLSVVMATYNGEKYLQEQLDSVRDQVRPADEVIIRDDCSTDNTCKIMGNYIRKNGLISWKYHRNDVNGGWMRNFKNAISSATGDWIILADQDDIWNLSKLKIIEEILEKHEKIVLLVSSYNILQDGKIIYTCYDDEKLLKIKVNKKIIHNNFPGCVYAVRRNFFEEILPYWCDCLPHDAQLSMFAKINGGMYWYRKPLITYRRHDSNVTKRKKATLEQKIEFAEWEVKYSRSAKQYFNDVSNNNSENVEHCIEKSLRYSKIRIKLLKERKKLDILKILRYTGCYIKKKTFFGDVYFVLKKGESLY